MRTTSTEYTGTPGDPATVKVNGRQSLLLRLDLKNHSPGGFAWGYGGSGPSQLALAMLADFLEDDDRALRLYQPFKWRMVAQWPQDKPFTLTGQQIIDMVKVLEAEHPL